MDDSSLQFAQPLWILAGVIVCAGIIGLFIRFDRRREADLSKLIHPRFRQRLTEGFSPWRRALKRGLWVASGVAGLRGHCAAAKGFRVA